MIPEISIIIPVYNAEKSIRRCIESILQQTYVNFEILIINDGSIDNTIQICESFKDSRIRIINQRNLGVSAARNCGIQNASGKYIQFVDADDYLDDTICEELHIKAEKESAELVICAYKIIHKDSFVDTKLMLSHYDKWKDNFIYLFEEYYINPVWNKLYLRSKIKHSFDSNIIAGEDLLFNIRYLLEIDKVVLVNKALYSYFTDEKLRISSHSFCSLKKIYSELDSYIMLKLNNDIETHRICDERYIKEYFYYLKLLVKSEVKQFDFEIDHTYIENVCKRRKIDNIKKIIENMIILFHMEKVLIFLMKGLGKKC